MACLGAESFPLVCFDSATCQFFHALILTVEKTMSGPFPSNHTLALVVLQALP